MTGEQVSTWFANARRRLKKENLATNPSDETNGDEPNVKGDAALLVHGVMLPILLSVSMPVQAICRNLLNCSPTAYLGSRE